LSEQITERSLYPHLSTCLSRLGFTSLQEIDLGGEFLDIEFWHQSEKFILEVKIGKWETKLIEGVLQAKGYAQKAGTENVIVVVYAPEVRRPIFPEMLEDITLKSQLDAFVLTSYWKEAFIREKRITAVNLFTQLAERVQRKEKIVSLDLVIETVRDGITLLSEHLRALSQVEIERLVNTVVGKFDLFLALGQTRGVEKEDLKLASIDLSAYLLVNQILFYHIYNQLSGNVPPLHDIADLSELQGYFRKITDINYRAIYSVDVISRFPRTPRANEIVRKIVGAIKTIGPERVKHDLLGRIFHELLPPATRKVLAAFYTRPVAAEILAALVTDSPDETVLDPACGSGTLLVSTYRRKMELSGPKTELDRLVTHTKFVERDITGIDIVPFAAHLTAIHLASQNLKATTDKVRVGVKDSLRCRPGATIEPFAKEYQRTLLDTIASATERGAISLKEANESFDLSKTDVVIMNPPFTKEERLPEDYRSELKKFADDLKDISGGAAGLWGYFIALATKFSDRKIACVIPINLLRGKASLPLREFLLGGNYTWKYLVKCTENYGFTEKSEYRDILLVIHNGEPKAQDKLCVVLLKRRLEMLSLEEASRTGKHIKNTKEGEDIETEDLDLYWITHDWLLRNKRHLMPMVAFSSLKNMKFAWDVVSKIIDRGGKKLTKPREEWFVEGLHTSPQGVSQVVFLTRPFHKGRIEEAFIILQDEKGKYIHGKIQSVGEDVYIDKNKVLPSLRTLTGVMQFDIADLHDYVVISPYPKCQDVMRVSKLKVKELDWSRFETECKSRLTNLTVAHRINWYSPNVAHLAFYSDRPYAPSDQMKVVRVHNQDDAKIMALTMNSTPFLLELFMFKEETTGRYLNIRIEDLTSTHVLDPEQLTKMQKIRLLQLFDELGKTEFPGFRQQFKQRFHGRVELDNEILRVLGLSTEEIKRLLPKLYDMLYEEMMKIRSLRKD